MHIKYNNGINISSALRLEFQNLQLRSDASADADGFVFVCLFFCLYLSMQPETILSDQIKWLESKQTIRYSKHSMNNAKCLCRMTHNLFDVRGWARSRSLFFNAILLANKMRDDMVIILWYSDICALCSAWIHFDSEKNVLKYLAKDSFIQQICRIMSKKFAGQFWFVL